MRKTLLVALIICCTTWIAFHSPEPQLRVEQIFSGEISAEATMITGNFMIELETSEWQEEDIPWSQVQPQATDSIPPTCTATYTPSPYTSGEVIVTLTCSEPVEFCGSDYADCPQPAPTNRPNRPIAGSACATAPDITYNGYTIMACNIGATRVATSLTDTAAYGYYFQRGNNYGFWNGISGQTDQDWKTTINTSTTQVNIMEYWPSNFYSSSTFTIISSFPYDRDLSDNKNRRGGSGDTTIANWAGTHADRQWPCPTGYHVPSTLEWKNLLNGSNPYNLFSTLKIPLAGYRYIDASLNTQDSHGRYWSSSPYPYSPDLTYDLLFASSSLSLQDDSRRTYGYSVRCFKNS